MRIDIEIDTDLFLESSFKFLPEIFNKLRYPAVVLVVFLAITDEDVIIISFDYA
jgi:hypothetical protein